MESQEAILKQGIQIIDSCLKAAEDEGGFDQAVDWLVSNERATLSQALPDCY